MNLKGKTVILVLNSADADLWKRDRPAGDLLLSLTPDARAGLLGAEVPVISSDQIFTQSHHRRAMARARRAERYLFPIIEAAEDLDSSTKETFLNLIRAHIASAGRAWEILSEGVTYKIASDNGWKTCPERNSAYREFSKKLAGVRIVFVPPPRKSLFPYLTRMVNRFYFRNAVLGEKKNFVVFNNDLYGSRTLMEKISTRDPNIVCMRLEDNGGYFRDLIAALKRVRRRIRFGAAPEYVLPLVSIPRRRTRLRRRLTGILNELRDPVLRTFYEFFGRKLIEDSIYSAGLLEDTIYYCGLARPISVVMNSARLFREPTLPEAARRLGIPAYLISHGSHPEPEDGTSRYEHRALARGLLYSPLGATTVLQTPHAERALNDLGAHVPVIKTRPLMWAFKEKPASTPAHGPRVILHAGTFKYWWAWRPWIYETSDEYCRGLEELVRATESIPNIKLVIRVRDMPECSVENLERLLPAGNHYTLKSGGAFLDDLMAASLLVSFSSTTLEESLQYGKPVLLWGGNGRYRHLPVDPEGPGKLVFEGQPGSLSETIRNILDRPISAEATVNSDHVWNDPAAISEEIFLERIAGRSSAIQLN